MHCVNTPYAQYFNRVHGRRGYLFQDRFKSIATQDQNYVEELVRYVHLNPVRAGVCPSVALLETYPWSGHAVLVGNRTCEFQHTADVLRRFGRDSVAAVSGYRQFVQDGLGVSTDSDLAQTVRQNGTGKNSVHDTGCWVIGDQAFVTSVMQSDKARRTRLARYRAEGWTLDRLFTFVAKGMETTEKDMRRRSRGTRSSDARKVFVYLGHRILEIPLVEIARFLGISSPAASMCITEGEQVAIKEGSHLQI